jgi:YVTN family beta-propeller protein
MKISIASAAATLGVSVIATATNTVAATIRVGNRPYGVAITPDGAKLYVTNQEGTVSVIATATNTVTATIQVGNRPYGVAVTRMGARSMSLMSTTTRFR